MSVSFDLLNIYTSHNLYFKNKILGWKCSSVVTKALASISSNKTIKYIKILIAEKNFSIKTYLNIKQGWAPAAYNCNPSYSGGRDQGDRVQSQPTQIIHKTRSQKNPSQKKKKGLVEWLKM
jgi:hypothetical protein